ncbi:MAG: hypothetical protein KatS3mg101_0691 [Patescibacteria group bacterium]|nr:MAG: hypothetical protein KatS3mg101_0691 [Patescibacteria group bacterium]
MSKAAFLAILFPVLLLLGLAVFGSRIPQRTFERKEKQFEPLTKLETTESTSSAKENYQINPMGNVEKEPPKMTLDLSKKYTALMNTSEGLIKIELFADKTPVTVNNFVTLSRSNFYDNVIFHRVIKGFMIQSGDPTGTGAGGPGYKFNDEPFEGDYTRGTVAMANAGPNTNGSQFFIMHQDKALPKNYVIFGKVIEGMEVVDKIAETEVEITPEGEPSKPIKPVRILNMEIIESD